MDVVGSWDVVLSEGPLTVVAIVFWPVDRSKVKHKPDSTMLSALLLKRERRVSTDDFGSITAGKKDDGLSKKVSANPVDNSIGILGLVWKQAARHPAYMDIGDLPVHDCSTNPRDYVQKVSADQFDLYPHRTPRNDTYFGWSLLLRQSAVGVLDGTLVRLDSE